MAEMKFVFPFDSFKPNRLVHFDVAKDDRVWYFPTNDLQQVSDLLSNPYQWAHKTQSSNGWSPTIAPYFVISFQLSASNQLGGNTPFSKYIIHGINGTGCITVTIAAATEQAQDRLMMLNVEDPTDPGDFTVQAENGLCFWHMHLGDDPALRDFILSNAVVNPDYLIRWMNGLQQYAPGLPPMPLNNKFKFQIPADPTDMTVMYEGSIDGIENKYTCHVGDASASPDDEYKVVVNAILVKTYPRAGTGILINLPLSNQIGSEMSMSAITGTD